MEWKHLSVVQRHKSRGIKTWYLRENSRGVISYRSLGTTCKKVAKECLQRLLVLRFALPGEASEKIPVKDSMNRFLDRPSLKGNSVEQYARILKHFVGWCELRGIMDIQKIDDKAARDYYASLEGKSAVHRCRVCGCFMNWIFRENSVARLQPFKFVEFKREPKTVRDSWSIKDVDRIVAAAPSREMRMLWALMAYAGLRIHEAANLRDGDIHGDQFQVIGKGDKFAVLPLNARLFAELKRFGPLGDGLKISKQKSIRELQKVCDRLGIDGWVANHKFRHSFASNLAASGCPVAVAMRLLRHSSSAMTLDVYTHIVPTDMREWAEKVCPNSAHIALNPLF